MNRKVAAPLGINDGKVHWKITKPTSVGGVFSWCMLIGVMLGAVTGTYAFYQTSKDTTKNHNRLELEHSLLKAKVDSMEAKVQAQLSTNRSILQRILQNTSTNGNEATTLIDSLKATEKASIALAETQRKEREAEIIRRLKKKQ